MPLLDARDAYRLWAPSYERETAVSLLEDGLVRRMTPPLAGRRLLDTGCGTGRRLREAGAAVSVGVDLSPEMIGTGRAANSGVPGLVTHVGDVRDLPVPDRSFDVVWCRLVLGHLPDLHRPYAELARAGDDGVIVIVSDFHPSAYRQGHRRTFRADGQLHEIVHHDHSLAAHADAARAAGLVPVDWQEAVIGSDVRHFYEEAGRPALYAEHFGLPLVMALAFEKEG